MWTRCVNGSCQGNARRPGSRDEYQLHRTILQSSIIESRERPRSGQIIRSLSPAPNKRSFSAQVDPSLGTCNGLAYHARLTDEHHHREADYLGRTVEITERIAYPLRLRKLAGPLKKIYSNTANSRILPARSLDFSRLGFGKIIPKKNLSLPQRSKTGYGATSKSTKWWTHRPLPKNPPKIKLWGQFWGGFSGT